MNKQTLRRLHIQAGVILALPLMVLAVTGVALTWYHAAEHAEGRAFMRAHAAMSKTATVAGEEPIPMRPEAMLSAARLALAEAGKGGADLFPVKITAPEAPDLPASVMFKARGQKPHEEAVRVFVLPDGTAAAPAEERLGYFWLMRLHMHMAVPGAAGRNLVGGLGLALVAAAVLGLWLRLNSGISGRLRWFPPLRSMPMPARIRSLHGAGALHVAAPLLFLAVSGVYLAWPWAAQPVTLAFSPSGLSLRDLTEKAKPKREGAPSPAVTADMALLAAERAFSGARVRDVNFPVKPGDPWRVTVSRPDDEFLTPPSVVLTDAATGGLAAVIDSRTLETAQSFPFWIRRLHGAPGGGAPLWLKVLFTLGGVSLAALPVTGLWLWRRRGGA